MARQGVLTEKSQVKIFTFLTILIPRKGRNHSESHSFARQPAPTTGQHTAIGDLP